MPGQTPRQRNARGAEKERDLDVFLSRKWEGKAGLMAEVNSPSPECMFGSESPPQSCKSSPLCPHCGSNRSFRDGLRYLADGNSIQRWLCRSCGLRFSDPEHVNKARRKAAEI